jgi:LemA protein
MYVIAALIAGAIVMGLIVQYNRLVYLRQLVRNAWSDVDVYLKRRAELIPNLTASVKAYAAHEYRTFEQLAEARTRSNSLMDAAQRSEAESAITTGLSKAIMIAENYPELKANRNFLALQDELTETEGLIANARQYYNACVRDYNTKIEAFPSNLVAPLARCRYAEFFDAGSVATLTPEVKIENAPLSQNLSSPEAEENPGSQSQQV